MVRMYAAAFDGTTFSADATDVVELIAGTDIIVQIHSIYLGASSDPGDIQAEMLRLTFSRATTAGSGGGTITPAALDPGDPTSDTSLTPKRTTAATGLTLLVSEVFNLQVGWFWRPTPDERITFIDNEILVLRLEDAPADQLTMSCTVIYEEISTFA